MFLNSLLLLYTIIVNISRRKRKKEKITAYKGGSYLRPQRRGKCEAQFFDRLLTNGMRFATIKLIEN